MKSLKSLGKVLNRAEQREINGGKRHCATHADCGRQCCNTAGWCQTFGDQGNTGFLCDGDLI